MTSSNSVWSICSPWIRSVSPEFVDLDLLQHLADDHLDVLVVDADALQPIDLLDLVDQIARKLLDALDRQDIVRRRIAIDDVIALLDDIAILQVDVLAFRDQIFARLLARSRWARSVMRRLFL